MKKRTVRITVSTVAGLLLLTGIGLAYVKFALPNVGPAPVLTVRTDAARVEHGRYLANNIVGCVGCHSLRDFTRLAGPVMAGTEGKGGEGFLREAGFPGNYYPPNITPAHLGTWTDGEIYRAVTTGVNRDGRALFPIMPYQFYAKMDPEDIYDIIAYVRSLKPIQNAVPASESDFPMNFIINTIPTKAEPGKRPDTTNHVTYGRYLVMAAACIECHTPGNDRGQLLAGMEFAGGRTWSMPGGTVQSANITPAKTGIGAWSRADFIARFKSYDTETPSPTLGAGEMNTVMPWTMFAHATEQDLGAIYDFLRTVKPVENQVKAFTPKAKLVASTRP